MAQVTGNFRFKSNVEEKTRKNQFSYQERRENSLQIVSKIQMIS